MDAVDVAGALYLLLAALGLALAVSYAGLPVLGQSAFVAVGGFGTVLLGPDRAGLPLGLAAAVAVVTAGVLGYAVAYGASRLQGAFLALATWGLAWLAYAVLLAFPEVSGGSQGLTREAPARLVSPALGVTVTLTPLVHVGIATLLCVLAAAGLARLDRGPGGLDLAALREGPAVAESLGVPVAARRRAVIATTAALGAMSGAGTAVLLGLVAPADVSPLLSLELFVAVLIGGTARWWGPAVGVAVLTALPELAGRLATEGNLSAERTRGALTAALLVAVLAWRARPGRGRLSSLPVRTALATSHRMPDATGPAATGRTATASPLRDFRPVLLRAEGVVAGYGTRRVLDGVDLVLRAGEVHALVGPNGSGKSTLLRLLSGALAPESGRIEVAGRVVVGGGPADRVRLGVARTFQRTVVLPRLPPRAQVAIGARGGLARPYAAIRHLVGTPSSRAETALRRSVVAAALTATGLQDRAATAPDSLVVGEQRLLQVARVVATGARVLLLDEPAAGMSVDERARLASVLRRLAADGAAVLLVEHDMRLVGRVADRVTVLAEGRVLATGTAESVRGDPDVRLAYLGPEAGPPERVQARRSH